MTLIINVTHKARLTEHLVGWEIHKPIQVRLVFPSELEDVDGADNVVHHELHGVLDRPDKKTKDWLSFYKRVQLLTHSFSWLEIKITNEELRKSLTYSIENVERVICLFTELFTIEQWLEAGWNIYSSYVPQDVIIFNATKMLSLYLFYINQSAKVQLRLRLKISGLRFGS